MNFRLYRKYNYITHAPSLFIDNGRQNKVIGILDYETAKQYSNVDVIQRQIYPHLPPGTPDKTADYTYVLFQAPSGIKYVLAYPWIVENSIQEVAGVDLNVMVYDVDDTAVGKITDVMNSLGYKFQVKVLNP